ncbi:MAG: hypothetical protein ACI35R_17945 [Bacillus sp. (in: firmicutes)]
MKCMKDRQTKQGSEQFFEFVEVYMVFLVHSAKLLQANDLTDNERNTIEEKIAVSLSLLKKVHIAGRFSQRDAHSLIRTSLLQSRQLVAESLHMLADVAGNDFCQKEWRHISIDAIQLLQHYYPDVYIDASYRQPWRSEKVNLSLYKPKIEKRHYQDKSYGYSS